MPERLTAEVQLARILQTLPWASREDGATLTELARRTGVPERELVRDLEEVYTRCYYRPAGAPDDVSVLIESDRVEVWTSGEFRRPVGLSPREVVALGLGLRMLGIEGVDGMDDLLALGARLEGRLREAMGREQAPLFAVQPGASAAPGIRAVLERAARERTRCRIRYLRSGAEQPETRDIDPYALMIAHGLWYAIAYCHARQGIRVFRLDRMLDASLLEDHFEVPDDFDPEEYVSGGSVYRADQFEEVTIRYSPAIARWLAESGPVETLPDGAVLVRYAVSDPSWAVRHVLAHAPEAEIVSPARLRELVTSIVEILASSREPTKKGEE